MDIFKKVKRMVKKDPSGTAEKLGYSSAKKADAAIQAFISHKSLCNWLNSGFFDFKYGADDLFETLCRVCGVDEKNTEDAIKKAQADNREIDRCRGAYIHFRTEKGPHSVFAAMAYGAHTHISINSENLAYKSRKVILEEMSNFIREHFKSVNGRIDHWGKIEEYKYHHYDGTDYVFDTEGNLIPDGDEISEPKATLEVNGKDIIPLITR